MSSTQRTDQQLIQNYISDPEFPYLVSFPRTGSHWLRMIMELYFEKPSLVRIFYFMDATDFTCYHWHDQDLELKRNNVIYLWRHPLPTVYSQLNYYDEGNDNIERIEHWSTLYGKHLSKWLFENNFTKKMTVLTYERMKENIYEEFKKVCIHFDTPFDAQQLSDAVKRVNKNEVKRKTAHDKQVINNSDDYEQNRLTFSQKYSDMIMNIVISQNLRLADYF